jgi:hypothetical protein
LARCGTSGRENDDSRSWEGQRIDAGGSRVRRDEESIAGGARMVKRADNSAHIAVTDFDGVLPG